MRGVIRRLRAWLLRRLLGQHFYLDAHVDTSGWTTDGEKKVYYFRQPLPICTRIKLMPESKEFGVWLEICGFKELEKPPGAVTRYMVFVSSKRD